MRANRRYSTIVAEVLLTTVAMVESGNAQYFKTPELVDIDVSVADWAPYFSSDGREIFVTHWSGGENFDIFTAQKDGPNDRWGNSESVSELINYSDEEDGVTLSEDGLTMIFGSERMGLGSYDLWQTRRAAIGADWEEPINLKALNTSGGESTPSLSKDGLTLYFASGCCFETRPGSRSGDIWISKRRSVDSEWSTPVTLSAVNSTGWEAYPNISEDELTLYFVSDRRGTYGIEDIYVSTRKSVNEDFGKPMNLGPIINSKQTDFSPHLGRNGKLYYTWDVIRGNAGWRLWQADPRVPVAGDFNGDESITVQDIDILNDAIFRNRDIVGSDLTNDGLFDFSDVRYWVERISPTWFGDANLDWEFNSADLTVVFQVGQYEDSRRTNSTWATGDWNGDREFNSSDLVVAFQDAGYEVGPRNVAAVPEPAMTTILLGGLLGIGVVRRAGNRLKTKMVCAMATFVCLFVSSASAVDPPMGLGKYAVGHRRLEIVDTTRNNRPLPIDTWYPVNQDQAVGPLATYDFAPGINFAWPSRVAHETATISTMEQFPLVIFSPGSSLPGNTYSDFGEAMASHGFIFASISHTGDLPLNWSGAPGAENQSARDRPRDIQFTIDQMLLRNTTAGDSFFGTINDQAIGAAGHSFGAVLTFAAQSGYEPYGIKPDLRIRAIMPISPGSNSDVDVIGQRATVPSLLMDGTRDFGVNTSIFRGQTLTEMRHLVSLKNGTHLSYSNFCERLQYAQDHSAPQIVLNWYDTSQYRQCDPSVMPNVQGMELTHFFGISFFKKYLNGETEYAEFLSPDYAVEKQLPATVSAALLGDFDLNLSRDARDIDLLNEAIRSGTFARAFSLNRDRVLDQKDRDVWVKDLVKVYYGDSNLDGQFDSTDLTEAFRAGQYEDEIALNSGWASGDWNGDGDFTTGDFVVAFQDGGYEKGPRAAVNGVPEPTSLVLVLTAALGCVGSMRRSGSRQTSDGSRRRFYWEGFGC